MERIWFTFNIADPYIISFIHSEKRETFKRYFSLRCNLSRRYWRPALIHLKYLTDEAPTPAKQQDDEDYLGPPPAAANASWQCEHCTFVNEPGVRVCAVCCRTPTAAPKVIEPVTDTNTRFVDLKEFAS